MARTPQRSRGGPGFVGMIIFLVLSVVLALACVFLASGYLKRGASLVKLQGEIKKDLEEPLGRGLGIMAQSVASMSDVAYDDAFFNRIQKSASDGMEYAKLVAMTGYNGVDEIKDELQKAPPPAPEQLHAYVTKLIQDGGALQRQLNERNTALQLATEQTKTAQDRQAQADAELKANLDKSAKQLKDAQDAYDKDLATIKALMTKADEDAKKAWADNREQAEIHKKELATLQDQITTLKQKINDQEVELTRKRPKAVAVTKGAVLQADSIEGVAIINLGKKEQIQNGEKFTVVRIGKGGERIPKGELQVVRVEDLVSTTEILKSDPNDPVMRDDIVQREKKTE